jgi:hypothetical protein
MARAAPLLVFVLWSTGCEAAPPPDEPPPAPSLPRGAALALPGDWRTLSPLEFERWILAALPEDQSTPLDDAARPELAAALDEVTRPRADGGLDPVAVRAALILGRSRHPTSAALLIRRLERRVLGPERWSDCGDTLAAAALARFPDPRRYAQRLVPLAAGSRPHPDLEVRVECAATALHAGFTEGVPFLLQVLRIDTRAGERDVRDFPVAPTTAWARGRAAEALSIYAGVPLTYQTDASDDERAREAAKLEERVIGHELLPASR